MMEMVLMIATCRLLATQNDTFEFISCKLDLHLNAAISTTVIVYDFIILVFCILGSFWKNNSTEVGMRIPLSQKNQILL